MYILLRRLFNTSAWSILGTFGLLSLGMHFALFAPHGLDQPVPVAPYVNKAFAPGPPGADSGAWQVVNAFPNLNFSKPVFLAEEPGTGRLFVGEHRGIIYAFPNTPTASQRTQVLDIRSRTWFSGESGLLSFAFHPRYANDSNYLYVFYQYNPPNSSLNYSRISRFTVDPTSGTVLNNSEMVLIQQYDRASNHNGGMLFFGNDGYLYVSTGDEGGGNNQYNNSQSITNRLLGGVLRIDVDRDRSRSHPIRRQPTRISSSDQSFTANYYIPNDNPFLATDGSVLEEFYAVGLRNPHRMSQDPTTGTIWLADVGQGKREEVDLIEKGGNYQWGYREGFLSGPQSRPSNLIGIDIAPIHDYPRSDGISITGGYVYRGSQLPSLQGAYVFGDYGSKRLWVLREDTNGNYQREQLLTLPFSLASFGIDAAGELYLMNFSGGKIEKLTREQTGNPAPPTLLSQTGVFQSLSPLIAEDFCISYELNVPFWSDGAEKFRWLILPNDGQHDSPGEQIQYAESDNWQLPAGAVLVKHFELDLDPLNPGPTRKLETRFMIFGPDNSYYGLTYRWNEAQTDAVLLTESKSDTFTLQTAAGTRKISWYYPGSGDCITCHTPATGGVLGLKTGQLNRTHFYDQTQRQANQLTTYAHLNMLDTPLDTQNLGALPFFPPSSALSYSVESRARAYLDANCSSCHRPGVDIQANFDARMATPLPQQSLVYGELVKDLGQTGARTIIPGETERSMLLTRLKSIHTGIAMPQLAKNEVDSAGVDLITSWIQSLPADVEVNGDTGQKIQFGPLNTRYPNDPTITLNATSSSGLPVSFQVQSGPAAISGNELSLTGSIGKVNVIASQGGNTNFMAAPEVRRSFWVVPPGNAVGRGLEGTYYSDENLSIEAFRQVDSQIDFNWGSDSPDPAALGYDSFSIRWEGELEPPYSETYTFVATTDDGVRLWVNNTLIIDTWDQNGPGETSGTLSLTAWEKVPIRMEYREEGTFASASLQWSSPSIAPEIIPQQFLYSPASETPVLHVWLEGYFDPQMGMMNNELQAGQLIPSQQPFQDAPLNYDGPESLSSNNAYIIDWLLIEVRSTNAPEQVLGRQAVLVGPDGVLMNTDFSQTLVIPGLPQGAYLLALYPKGHLPVISSQPIPYSPTLGLSSYDFSQPSAIMGSEQLKNIGGYYVLHSGDFDYNGIVNNQDFNLWKQNSAAINQYLPFDADGNGIVNNLDFNLWKINGSKLAVPPVQK